MNSSNSNSSNTISRVTKPDPEMYQAAVKEIESLLMDQGLCTDEILEALNHSIVLKYMEVV